MDTRKFLLYTAPLVLLFNTAPASFGVNSEAMLSSLHKTDSQIEELKTQYSEQEQIDLDQALTDADNLVEKVALQAEKDANRVPNTLYSSPQITATNAEYEATVSEIRTKEKAEISDIYDRAARLQVMIKEAYEQKICSLDKPLTDEQKATEQTLAIVKHQ